jgi:ABC-type polysaccharide/polyol phosphate transport system ATPase subunit
VPDPAPPAIQVSHLTKRYRLGVRDAYGSLRDSLTNAITAPVRAARTLFRTRDRESDESWLLALNDVSFDVADGEIVGIVGSNGSGKSTLLKVLSGITEPFSGRALVRGRIGSLLEVGTGFHPELSGRENVFVNGAILGMRHGEIARKFDEIVAFSSVERFIDTPVKHYSSGMQMRLAFAVAAHLEPDILLVDEVLAVGDIEFQKKCLGKMDDVSRHGRTILFVSHQMNQLRRLCTRCVWLEKGRVKLVGPTNDVLSRYEQSVMNSGGEGARQGVFVSWNLSDGGRTVDWLHAPVVVQVHISLAAPLTRGHFGLGLQNDRDELVAGWAFEPLSLPAGDHVLEVKIETLPLRPGSYRFALALFDQGSNLTGGRLLDKWIADPPLSLAVPPLSHPQDEWAGVLNVPAELASREAETSVAAIAR